MLFVIVCGSLLIGFVMLVLSGRVEGRISPKNWHAYKKFYKTAGYKKLIVDDNIMASIEKVYQEGRNVIVKQYPEYYLWDFYNINENFDYTFKQIPPDKSECLIVGFKMNRNRGTKWSFIVTGFVKLFGKYYGEEYNENINFKVNIYDILSKSPAKIEDNPNISEQDYLSWLLGEVNYAVSHEIIEAFKEVYEAKKYGKRITMKIHDLEKQAISAVWAVFSLNGKDESFKNAEEMSLDRNTYEVIRQRPLSMISGKSMWPYKKVFQPAIAIRESCCEM